MVAHYYRTDRHVSQQMETSQTSFFLFSLPKRKRNSPQPRRRRSVVNVGFGTISRRQTESRILGTAARGKPETSATIVRERRMKRKRTNKEKRPEEKENKSRPPFSCWDGEGGAILWRIFFVFCDPLSLSLSLSGRAVCFTLQTSTKSPCRYANAPAGVAPAFLIAPYSSFGSHVPV